MSKAKRLIRFLGAMVCLSKYQAIGFPGLFIPWTVYSLDCLLPGLFIPWPVHSLAFAFRCFLIASNF
jgi:hypothetical protein